MTTPQPRRDGKHPIYREYLGGSELDDNYSQKISGIRSFKYPSQLRNIKQLSVNQKTLMDAKKDVSMLKFDGMLELKKDDSSQLDKEQFITALSDEVKYYGLQTFFFLPKIISAQKYRCFLLS